MADATSFLLGLLTPGQVLLALGVLVVTLLVFDFVSTPKYPRLPTVGHQGGILSSLRNIVDYPSCFREWLLEGFVKYNRKGQAFKTPRILSKSPDIVLPKSQTMWMLNQPDHILSHLASHESILRPALNFLDPRFATDEFHSKVIHRNLARSLTKLIPFLQEEVAYAIDKAFGTDVNEWKYVNLWDAWITIVPLVTSRILVGSSLNRDDEYLSAMVKHADCVVRNNIILDLVPKILHPIVNKLLIINVYKYWKIASRKTIPIIKERQQALARKDSGDTAFANYVLPDDFISWIIKLAKEEGNEVEYDPICISKRLLPINFAAIHTTVLTGHSAFVDLFSSDPAKGEVTDIREEIAHVFAKEKGKWTKAGLARLVRTDSSIKESQRRSPFGVTLVKRMVVAKEGITNEAEGWHAPHGSCLVLNYNALHHDEEIYKSPDEYDAFRFSRQRETMTQDKKDPDMALKLAKMGMVTTTESHVAFGHGRHACPGRFFVAHEIKMVIAYLLLNFDIMSIKEKPKDTFFGQIRIPATDVKVKVRRRMEPFVWHEKS